MKKVAVKVLALLLWVLLTSCGGGGDGGGGGGGSGNPDPPAVSFDAVSPATFTPPATTSATFNLSGGTPTSTALEIFMTTGTPGTLQYLGSFDTQHTSPGTHSKDWDGYTAFWVNGPVSVALPMEVVTSSSSSVALYRVELQRQPMKTNGIVFTGAENPMDARLYFELNQVTGDWAFVDITDMAGNSISTFDQVGPVPGQPGWDYAYEELWIYDQFLGTSTGTFSRTLNNQRFDWSQVLLGFDSVAGDYELRFSVRNSAGSSVSTRKTVSIP